MPVMTKEIKFSYLKMHFVIPKGGINIPPRRIGQMCIRDSDIPLMQKLMNAVGEMSVTFHRAFDMCSNPKEALEQIIRCV